MNYFDNHTYILDLARSGATRFALAEYERFGLNQVGEDEDIMALHGRLYKDIYLTQSGEEAIYTARLSAEKYEAAFMSTHGFYSGINSATMSLLAGFPSDMIRMRAQRILDALPSKQDLDAQTYYFIEATRAEAHLLLGHDVEAQRRLCKAIEHDPLNYTAHASTIKQFNLIGSYLDTPFDWLSEYSPPKTMHFAGHINIPDLVQTKEKIADWIQREDIGFGYGSLAAGADIMIAEALLDEGAELHVILPVSKAIFLQHSVEPFGHHWSTRFQRCLSEATKISIKSELANWPNPDLDKQAVMTAMGRAIRRARSLSVDSSQLLIWDKADDESATKLAASLWNKTAFSQHIIQELKKTNRAVELQKAGQADKGLALCAEFIRSSDSPTKNVELLHEKALPGTIFICETIADKVTLDFSDELAAYSCGTTIVGHSIFYLSILQKS